MRCLKEVCSVWSECKGKFDKKVKGNVVTYFIPAIAPDKLPDDCPIKRYLRG